MPSTYDEGDQNDASLFTKVFFYSSKGSTLRISFYAFTLQWNPARAHLKVSVIPKDTLHTIEIYLFLLLKITEYGKFTQ